jgi:outer membrane protein
MKKLTYLTLIIGFCTHLHATPTPLSINSLIEATLEHNFDLRLSKISVSEKEASIEQERGDYDYQLSSSHKRAKSDTPSSSSLDGAGNASSVKSKSTTSSLTMSKKLSTGTQLSLPYNVTITDSSSTARTIQKTYEPSIALSLSQPLLKGFDAKYVARDIEEARMDLEMEQLKEREEINDKAQEVLELYLDAILKYEQINIRKTGKSNSAQNLDFITQKHRLGKSSQIEFLEAKAADQKAVEALLAAEVDYQNAHDQLALKAFGDSNHQISFVNVSQLLADVEKMPKGNDVPNMVQQGLTGREKIKRYQIALSKAGFKLSNATRDRLPDLDLDATLTHKGLASTLSKANGHLVDGRYRSWNASLTLSKPLMGYAGHGYWQQQGLKQKQEEIRLEQARRDIRLEIQKSIRKLESSRIQIKAFTAALDAEEKKYTELKLRHGQGRASTYELNQGLQALQSTQVSLLRSRIDYLKSFYGQAAATGALLPMVGISLN